MIITVQKHHLLLENEFAFLFSQFRKFQPFENKINSDNKISRII